MIESQVQSGAGGHYIRRKAWGRPELRKLDAGDAEARDQPGNDNTGGHTRS